MRRSIKVLARAARFLLVFTLMLELCSFAAITASNLIIYGSRFEGGTATYDAHALFVQGAGVRPTLHNQVAVDRNDDRVVWMFGGSTMRGSTDDDGKTIASHVARTLNERNRRLRFTVVNYGVDSFNSLLEIKYLQKLLIEESRRPHLIIFLDGANDSTYFPQYRTPYGHHDYRNVRALIECYRGRTLGILKPLNAAFYASFTKELIDKFTSVARPLDPSDSLLAEFASLTSKRYDHAQKLATCYGADFLVIWQPLHWVENGEVASTVRDMERATMLPTDRFSIFRSNVRLTYDAVSAQLSDRPYFVNFRNILCSRRELLYREDGVHLRDPGRVAVAAALCDLLQKRYGY